MLNVMLFLRIYKHPNHSIERVYIRTSLSLSRCIEREGRERERERERERDRERERERERCSSWNSRAERTSGSKTLLGAEEREKDRD